jgi:hypothetical protein
MDWSQLFRWEWLLIDLPILGLAIWQLVSVKREIRKSREAEAAKQADPQA